MRTRSSPSGETCGPKSAGMESRASSRLSWVKGLPLEGWRRIHVDGLDGFLFGPPAVRGGRWEVQRVARRHPERPLVLELDEERAGDHVYELLPGVGVETLAPRARRHPDVGRVHDLLTR